MADSQVRAALTNLGADVRADFYHTLAAWQNHWLLPASASPSDWLATDHLVAEVGSIQAPFDSLLDLQRFLTAGFLPSVNTPHAESVPAAPAARTSTASGPPAAGRATNAAPSTASGPPAARRATNAAPSTAGKQVAYPLPSPVDGTRGAAAPVDMHTPAASPSMALPQQPPTAGNSWTTPPSASMPSPDPRPQGTPVPDTLQSSGLRRPLAPQGSSSGAPLQAQASDPGGAGEPLSQAAPPTRIGGLRDLAQRLPAPWADPPESPASRLWPAHSADMPAPHVEEPQIAASTSPAASSLTRVPSQPAVPGTKGPAAALPPVSTSASTASTASVLHGQSEQIPATAPAAAIPPVHATLAQIDTFMDALAREITREYHRFYGA